MQRRSRASDRYDVSARVAVSLRCTSLEAVRDSREVRNILIQASSESRENYEVRRERETEVAVVAATKASESV